jgi:WD40 repeat protein/uncharacterized caspase-like protein
MPRVVSSTAPEKSPSVAKLWILAIGSDRYLDSSLNPLRYPTADCQGFVEVLTLATEKLPQKEFFIHCDRLWRCAERNRVQQKPNLEEIRASLQHIISQAQEQDTILFYFSGHGLVSPDTQQPFLCLADTDSQDLQNTGLSLSQLLRQLGNSKAQKQLVLLDACHSGSLSLRDAPQPDNTASQLVDVLKQHAAQTKGFYAILSCDKEQFSWEFTDLEHGIFTYYLIQGLKGAAADERGAIKSDRLYEYVHRQTLEYIDKTNQQLTLINQQKISRGETDQLPLYRLQTPKRIVEGVGEWIIGYAPKTTNAVNPRQALVVDGTTGDQTTLDISKTLRGAGGFELEYWLQPRKTWQEAQTAIGTWFDAQIAASPAQKNGEANRQTILLYLRGEIQETPEGEAWIVFGKSIRYSRSWLRQKLRQLSAAQQIIILDCPNASSLSDWVEDLRLEGDRGQCIIAASTDEPECFTQALWKTLLSTESIKGLPVAGWIALLQQELAGTSVRLHLWLSAAPGIIEVIPQNLDRFSATGDLKVCPYMGLVAFSEADAPYFFGREHLAQELINLLARRSFLAVVGASGSGKSSLVQAGLIAQLRQGKQIPNSDRWWIRCFRPGERPLDAIAQCLLDSDELNSVEGLVRWLRGRTEPMVVLVIDQFEELFTLASNTDRQRCLEILLGALEQTSDRFKIVVTLRADFIAPCLEIPALAARLQQSTELVSPQLPPEDYQRAIVQPAKKVGLNVEPELVETLLQELQNSIASLPLLQFVLEQLWECRLDGALTLRSYQQQIGGLKGALERKAQSLYESLSNEEKDCAQWIFLSLAQLGEGTEDTRRRVRKTDLIVPQYPAPLVEKTLQTLTAAKLTIVNTGSISAQSEITVEIAHEVLIRYWSTLRQWLEEERDRLRLQRQIERAADEWNISGRQADYLLRGTRLEEAQIVYSSRSDKFSQTSREFIEASAFAVSEQRRQEHQAKEDGVRASNLIAKTLFNENRQLEALTNSVKGGQRLRQIQNVSEELKRETLQTLHYICANISECNRFLGHEDAVSCVSFSPDGQALASGGLDATIKLWRRDGKLLVNFRGHTHYITDLVFTPDGQRLLSASRDMTVRLWHLDGRLDRLFTFDSVVRSIGLSSDGQMIAVAGDDGYLSLQNLNGKLMNRFQAHEGIIQTVTFSPDGQILASAGEDKSIKLWSLDGTLIKNITAHEEVVTTLCFSPDGQILASGSGDRTIKLWQLDGTLLKTLLGHSNRIASVTFTPDGQHLVSGSFDFTIKIWRKDGTELKTLPGHSEAVARIALSPDGEIIASVGADRVVKLWRSRNPLQTVLKGHQGYINTLKFSPDGKLLASAGQDRTIKFWDLLGNPVNSINAHDDQIVTVNFSSDGQWIISSSFDRKVKLWHLDGTLHKVFEEHNHTVYGATFSPDGQIIASASADGTVKLWDFEGNLLDTLSHPNREVVCVAFSPDSQKIISGDGDGTLSFWQLDGKLIKTIPGHETMILALGISPDGKILASASNDRTVKLWNIHGEPLVQLAQLSGPAYSISYSRDSKYLATATASNTVPIWNLDSRLEEFLISSQSQCIVVCFHPASDLLAIADIKGVVRLMPVSFSLEALLEFGENWLQDYRNKQAGVAESRHEMRRNRNIPESEIVN